MDKLRLPDSDFALTTDALDFMQKAYNYLENISLMGGQNYMLSGGEESNGVAADGIVVLNGEVMPFKGGSVQTNIRVVTVTSDVNVGVAQRQQITKYAEFGTSTNPDDNFVWADLQKTPKVADSFKLNGKADSDFAAANHTHDGSWESIALNTGWEGYAYRKTLGNGLVAIRGIIHRVDLTSDSDSAFFLGAGFLPNAFFHGYATKGNDTNFLLDTASQEIVEISFGFKSIDRTDHWIRFHFVYAM